jgi:Cys-tRNA(Pro)/Cys-tRNA(Cys) deacylase
LRGIDFKLHDYKHDPREESFGLEAATALGISPTRVYKTLVVASPDRQLAVAVLPVSSQLSLKKMAAAIGAKKVTMAAPAKVQNSTGYVLGGVSPIGQQKSLTTVLDECVLDEETIFVSAGKRGLEIELRAADLRLLCAATIADLKAN